MTTNVVDTRQSTVKAPSTATASNAVEPANIVRLIQNDVEEEVLQFHPSPISSLGDPASIVNSTPAPVQAKPKMVKDEQSTKKKSPREMMASSAAVKNTDTQENVIAAEKTR